MYDLVPSGHDVFSMNSVLLLMVGVGQPMFMFLLLVLDEGLWGEGSCCVCNAILMPCLSTAA